MSSGVFRRPSFIPYLRRPLPPTVASAAAQTVVAIALDASSAPGSGTVVVREQFIVTTAYDASSVPGSGTVVTAVATVVTTAYDASSTPGTNDVRSIESWRIVSVWPWSPRITSWCATSPGSRTE